jgi:hypothetical protein
MKWLEDQMRCRMNEMKKKMKMKKNWREERSDDCETAERRRYIDEDDHWRDECYTYMLKKTVRTYLLSDRFTQSLKRLLCII